MITWLQKQAHKKGLAKIHSPKCWYLHTWTITLYFQTAELQNQASLLPSRSLAPFQEILVLKLM